MASLPPFELYTPKDLNEAVKFMESSNGNVVIVASGTDLIPRVKRRQLAPAVLLNIAPFEDEMRYVRQTGGTIQLGALTTVTDLLDSPLFAERLSIVHEAAEKFGAPQIRNVATVGGNVCSASSSEDLIPVFLALDARVELVGPGGRRSLPLKDFVLGKRVTAIEQSEFLSEISFDSPKGNSWTAFEKMGRRNILIVALVSEALALSLEDDMMTVKSARIALNRVAGRVPALAEKTGDFLTGRKLTDETIEKAMQLLASELTLTSDYRSSAAYRQEVAQVYLKRLIQRCSDNIRRSG